IRSRERSTPPRHAARAVAWAAVPPKQSRRSEERAAGLRGWIARAPPHQKACNACEPAQLVTRGYNSSHLHAPSAATLRDRRTGDGARLFGCSTTTRIQVHAEARHPRLRRHGPAPAAAVDDRRQAAEHREAREAGRLLSPADDALSRVANGVGI